MKVKILSNSRKEWAVSLARSLRRFLESRGFRVSDSGADATLLIGGDGTIFHFFHYGQTHGPLLGIGSKTSRVCQMRHETLSQKALFDALKRKRVQKRLSISATDGERTFRSINDVVLHTHDYRVIRLFLKVNGKKYEFEGDGLIVSTPTGSSAYAYSAGGKMMKPDARRIGIVPICPYLRTLKPMEVGEKSEISVYADRDADLVIDGIYVGRIGAGRAITVKRGKDVQFLVV